MIPGESRGLNRPGVTLNLHRLALHGVHLPADMRSLIWVLKERGKTAEAEKLIRDELDRQFGDGNDHGRTP